MSAPSINVMTRYFPEATNQSLKILTTAIGSSQTTYQQIAATTFNDGNILWNNPPPNERIIQDKATMIGWCLYGEITNTAGVAPGNMAWAVPGDVINLRPYAGAQLMSSCSATFNNATVTNRPDQLIPYLNNTYNNLFRMKVAEPGFNYPQSYGQMIRTPSNGNYSSITQTQEIQSFDLKNAVWSFSQGSANFRTARFMVSWHELLYMSPFSFGGEREAGFTGLSTFQISIVLNALRRALYVPAEHDAASAVPITIGNVSLRPLATWAGGALPLPSTAEWPEDQPTSPTLYMTYYTPLLGNESTSITTRYNEIQFYPSNMTSWEYVQRGGGPGPDDYVRYQCTTNQVNLPAIPNALAIVIRPVEGFYNTDDFVYNNKWTLPIHSVNINFDNRNGVLNGASSAQLNRISQRNGDCHALYTKLGCGYAGVNEMIAANNPAGGKFQATNPGCLTLLFGEDIALNANQLPGNSGNYGINATVGGKSKLPNNNAYQFLRNRENWNCYMYFFYTGYMLIADGRAQTFVNLVPNAMAQQLPVLRTVNTDHVKTFYGGNWMGSLQSFLHNLNGVAQEVLPIARTGLSLMGYGTMSQQELKKRKMED